MNTLKKFIVLFFITTTIWGCATGSTVMLSGTLPEVPTSVEQVQLFLELPDRPYEVIAIVSSTADSQDFSSVSKAEGAALEKLKEQAAQAGADGVIDIVRELLDGGVIIYSDYLGNYDHRTAHSTTTLSRSFSINFKGKAIKFTRN